MSGQQNHDKVLAQFEQDELKAIKPFNSDDLQQINAFCDRIARIEHFLEGIGTYNFMTPHKTSHEFASYTAEAVDTMNEITRKTVTAHLKREIKEIKKALKADYKFTYTHSRHKETADEFSPAMGGYLNDGVQISANGDGTVTINSDGKYFITSNDGMSFTAVDAGSTQAYVDSSAGISTGISKEEMQDLLDAKFTELAEKQKEEAEKKEAEREEGTQLVNDAIETYFDNKN